MARGGRRAGAGRPRKRDRHARPIGKVEKLIAENLEAIARAQIALALGIQEERNGRTYWRVLPDRAAGESLLNRIMGRPALDLEIPEDGKVVVREVIVDV